VAGCEAWRSAQGNRTGFSPERAKVLAQHDELVDYFAGELKTLPPALAHRPLFEKLRSGLTPFTFLSKATGEGLNLADVKAIHAQARELNLAIRQSE
jgi:hypothetical protein